MKIGFIGSGYTADLYIESLKNYPDLKLTAIYDPNPEYALGFSSCYSVKAYPTQEALLADSAIELIVNLTNPKSHFEVSRACLEAGKHVYTEKPMATAFSESMELVDLAKRNGLYLSSAPCSILGESAQTLWRALRNNEIGTVRVVYADFDDGPVQLQDPHTWKKASGALFPYRDLFETGFPIFYAGYYLSWLAAFFGPARTIMAFSDCLWPDKQVVPEEPLIVTAPDFAVACVTFESGVVARLTCSNLAPHNHSMRIVGEKGYLTVEECLNYSSPVFLDKYTSLRFRAERYPITRTYPFIKNLLGHHPRVYRPVKKFSWKKRYARLRQDYARGVAELARAITEQRPARLPADYCLHVNELAWAIQNTASAPYQVTTTFKPLEPMDEASIKEFPTIKW